MELWRFEAIGTIWEIGADPPLTADERAAVREVIDDFDLTWSRFRADSLVCALAETPQEVPTLSLIHI